MYTKAIEEDQTDPVFYSNSISHSANFLGAAVYLAMDKIDESLTDCDKAIELNPAFVKVRPVASNTAYIGLL
jgi:hypothetical protein